LIRVQTLQFGNIKPASCFSLVDYDLAASCHDSTCIYDLKLDDQGQSIPFPSTFCSLLPTLLATAHGNRMDISKWKGINSTSSRSLIGFIVEAPPKVNKVLHLDSTNPITIEEPEFRRGSNLQDVQKFLKSSFVTDTLKQ
jgi:hypothetical protein